MKSSEAVRSDPLRTQVNSKYRRGGYTLRVRLITSTTTHAHVLLRIDATGTTSPPSSDIPEQELEQATSLCVLSREELLCLDRVLAKGAKIGEDMDIDPLAVDQVDQVDVASLYRLWQTCLPFRENYEHR